MAAGFFAARAVPAGSGAQADRGLARGAREGRAFLDPAVVARLAPRGVRVCLNAQRF